MKYRTKLYLALLGTALFSTIIGLGISYQKARTYLLAELRNKVTSIAATGTVGINGDILKKIQSTEDENSPDYKSIQSKLRAIRNLNRRNDIYVKFVYTLVPDKNNPKEFLFLVDAEENTVDFSHVGDKNPHTENLYLSKHYQSISSPNYFIYNKWGTWMTGYAPIFDSQGKYVATLAVDLQASDVISKLNRLIYFGLFAFLIALLIAALSAYFLARQTTRSLHLLCEGVSRVGKGNLDTNIDLKTHDEFNNLAQAINLMIKGLKERERLRLNFARYVSSHVLESILSSESELKLEGERRKVTILFSDIREFTRLSEKLKPEEVVALLNEYFALMVEIIFKNNGSLDKFMGDGLMVEFGAPLDDPMQESNAVKTAIEMQKAIKKLNEKWRNENKPFIKIGIGIHTGIAVVGNIGTEQRVEYTAIGDPVNIASRLEQLTKELKASVLISETTVEPIKKLYKFKNLGPVVLRGRIVPVSVYVLID